MAIWMAAVLAAAAFPPDDLDLPRDLQSEEKWSSVDGFVGARVGVWTGRSFEFDSIRTDSTQAKSKQQAFFSASLYAGARFYDHFVLMASYEGDLASKITAQVGGAYVGWRERPKERYGKGVPDDILIYAGVLLGTIEVDKTDFGDFKRGFGFGGGVAFGWEISQRATFQIFGEYRNLKFDYRRDVLSGDKSIGGNSGWFGLGLNYRF